MSEEDMDAAAFRAIVCVGQFEGLKWHRSYWDKRAGFVDCFYEAASVAQLQEHARVSRIPCDDVTEVTELVPETYVHG